MDSYFGSFTGKGKVLIDFVLAASRHVHCLPVPTFWLQLPSPSLASILLYYRL